MKFEIEPFSYVPSKSVLNKIKIVPSKEKLTAAAGLGTVVEIFDQSGLRDQFIKCLPERKSSRSIGSYKLALNMLCGFIHGFDCLDDFDHMSEEHALKALFGEETPAARTLGDFLRDFSAENISDLNRFLSRMGWSLLHSLQESLPEEFKPNEACLDIDSTDHPQSGNNMEGLAWNYKNHWCLDSQVVFDQMGFCRGFDLREGNTKSGVGADWLLGQALNDGKKQYVRKFEGRTIVRADSAYCNQDVIKTLVKKGVLFTLTAHNGTTHWKDEFEQQGLSWTPWVYTDQQKELSEKKGKELPQVELARFHWSPKWSQKEESKLVFPIIVKRTLNKERFEEARRKSSQLRLMQDDGYLKEDPYDYYAIVTNYPLDLATDKVDQNDKAKKVKRYSLQEVMARHQKRGAMENFIREEKYGYDLKHFPCQKLNANRAYGLLAMVAHNLLRWVSVMMRPERPHFSKKLRKRFVFHAGKVVKTARQTFLQIVEQGYKEVRKLREVWGFEPERIPLQNSSA
ncbi:MAG: IS1380 family transposase [Bdellovibrionales bacterium]|nr:IS1380 family transposase [Bdellovibrionales bacterium]MCB0415901.1 IS1380 family transposase [Bdellovibrionales bacterium]